MLNELWSHRIRQIITQEQIDDRVREIGKIISDKYTPDMNRLVLTGVMDGAGPFLFDLIKNIETKLEIFTIKVKTYDGVYKSKCITTPLNELAHSHVSGANVIVVDDILDTGETLDLIRKNILPLNPARLESAVLLDKQKTDIRPDYVGFNVCKDKFVIGYGLDYKGFYRNLPGVFEYHA